MHANSREDIGSKERKKTTRQQLGNREDAKITVHVLKRIKQNNHLYAQVAIVIMASVRKNRAPVNIHLRYQALEISLRNDQYLTFLIIPSFCHLPRLEYSHDQKNVCHIIH